MPKRFSVGLMALRLQDRSYLDWLGFVSAAGIFTPAST